MKNKLTSLLEVRKIVTFVVVVIFAILSLNGSLTPNFVENVILIVISYYFAKSTALDRNAKGEKNDDWK